jgi:hypothetical protein
MDQSPSTALTKYVITPTVLERVEFTDDVTLPVFVYTPSGQQVRNCVQIGEGIMGIHLSGPGWVEGEWLTEADA